MMVAVSARWLGRWIRRCEVPSRVVSRQADDKLWAPCSLSFRSQDLTGFKYHQVVNVNGRLMA